MKENNVYLEEIASYNLNSTCAVLNFLIDVIRRVLADAPFAVRQIGEGDRTYICIFDWRI